MQIVILGQPEPKQARYYIVCAYLTRHHREADYIRGARYMPYTARKATSVSSPVHTVLLCHGRTARAECLGSELRANTHHITSISGNSCSQKDFDPRE